MAQRTLDSIGDENARLKLQLMRYERAEERELVQEVRQKAADKLRRLLAAKGEVPKYEVLSPLYIGEKLVQSRIHDHTTWPRWQPNVIEFSGVPNDALKPVNVRAKRIMEAYVTSVGPEAMFFYDGAPNPGTSVDRPRKSVVDWIRAYFSARASARRMKKAKMALYDHPSNRSVARRVH
ncbi:MAG TPA: hypothetical protein VGV37_06350 [Aliidongia sp.]|uniref:hypothetical protein n=1 Tax=Aliidongia sp. TaxID=1914230 RepID=UPI002DDDA0FC|nr:hypothetical protein [Aliidongia sp.]HEV2674146.1 hypothetical protein [Aliidongia sp.]